MELILPKWMDLHVHFRQGPAMPHYIQAHLQMGCFGALAMPNTRPPVSRVNGPNSERSWSIESYGKTINQAGGDGFDHLIIPLYITSETTADMIVGGTESGLLKACKYYPPHGTTNAEHGLAVEALVGGDVLKAMEDQQVVLCIHGEQHGLDATDYLDRAKNAESTFYREQMPRLLDKHPRLRIVCEHITTQEAVRFVESADSNVAATITPQHLLFTLGSLIKGLRYHLYCLPVVKFEQDRQALREAVLKKHQTRFFAGTDSAPHAEKVTECGCAAGCFTGGCAPQLYAMAFEEAGADMSRESDLETFKNFLCQNGPRFYGFEPSTKTFSLVKRNNVVEPLQTPAGVVTPLPLGLEMELSWAIQSAQ